jgi:hypothetical protein
MKAVAIDKNPDGTYTARIFSSTFTGTYSQCVAWIHANNEQW